MTNDNRPRPVLVSENPPVEFSYIASMNDSKLEVVTRRKPAHPAVSREMLIASCSHFKAWERLPDTMFALKEQWEYHGLHARLAYGAMTSEQDALVKIWQVTPSAAVDEMLDAICCSSEILKITAQFMDMALIRYHAASVLVGAERGES